MCRALFFIVLLLVAAANPARAEDAVPLPDDAQWTTLHDFGERNGFTTYGPPLVEDAPRYRDETQLYLNMVQNFYVVSENEDDFAFVAEAFSVPVATFRPLSFRPEGKKAENDDVFADDPLPESYSSTSYYVDSIRPSFAPGGPFQPRALGDVKLGDDTRARSLFQDPPKKGKKTPDAPPKKAEADAGTQEAAQAGRINAPKKSAPILPGSDEETLQALRQAVQDLGLQKQLNFEPNKYSQTTAQMNDGKKNMSGAPHVESAPVGQSTTPASADAAPAAPPTQAKEPLKPVSVKKAPAKKAVAKPKPRKKKKPVAKPTPRTVEKAPLPILEEEEEEVLQPAPAPPTPAPGGISSEPDFSLKKSF